jgi:hypothetical protein
MRQLVLVVVALVAGATGGVLSSRALPEARAQPAGAVIVPVPAEGVVFRGAGGNAIARVRSDPAGGAIEVLDAHEQVAVRLRATNAGGVIELGIPRPTARTVLPLARTVDDPGY